MRLIESLLLDPGSKQFAENLLDEEGLFDSTRALLKEKHRDAWRSYNTPADDNSGGVVNTSNNEEEEEEELEVPTELHDDDDDDDSLGMVCELVEGSVEDVDSDTSDKNADEVFEKWMSHKVNFSKYVFDSQPAMKDSGTVQFKEIVAKFDTMKYFRETGNTDWPTICMLARIHFSKMDNSAFQERVFSTASNIMSKGQSRMAFDHLEMRTLLAQNKDLIRAGII